MENSSWNKTSEHPKEGSRAELQPGTRLGRYEILHLLGRGGMGQVYLARHELQKTLHALKILPSEFSGRAGFVERFRTELQTMARLQHPNIVHVQYSDVEAGLYYLVMDFVAADGTEEPYDLEEALAIEKRLEPEIVRRLMLRLCNGLSFAHGQGVVHRDLKPANVLLTSKDLSVADVKICDFGLARVVGEEQVRTLVAQSMQRSMSMGDQDTFTEKKRSERSSTGSVMGTYGYMSPEQEEGKPADERSDLYSLGVMMYRMITGQRLRGRAKAPSAVVPGLDKMWDAVIDKCLENDPAARCQSAAELRDALNAVGRAVGSTAGRADARPSPARRAALWLSGAAAIAAVSILSVRAIQASNAARAETARVAAASATLDAAQREKAAALGAVAEAALAAGDLKTAGEKIAELDRLGGTRVGVSVLRKRYEAKAGERETNTRYAVASLAREEAQKLDVSRRGAEARRGEADKAKTEADQAKSATDAADLYAVGGLAASRAAEAFEKGEFDASSKAWLDAAQSFASAKTRAMAVQEYRKVKASFEDALSRDRALLEKHGGLKWAEVQKQQKAGEAASSDPAEGSRAYGLALAALSGAVTEAKATEQDRLAKEKVDAEAEQRRLAAEKKAREEKQSHDLAEAAFIAWSSKAQPLAGCLEREAASVKGAAAKALLAETDALLAETIKLDSAKLSAASATELRSLQSRLCVLKAGIKFDLSPNGTQTVDLGGGVKIDLAWCPGGSFMMGSPKSETERSDGETQHRVTLTKGFWIGKTEVTQLQWETVMGNNPSRFKGADMPVETVSWDDCQAFIGKLNAKLETVSTFANTLTADKNLKLGKFRLPTEAEWEYACRAGTTGTYAGVLADMGWYFDNSGNATHAVGLKKANAWGLYDMHGNVWEWCQEWYGDYPSSDVTDPAGPASGVNRIFRGGCWFGNAWYCRSAYRGWNRQDFRFSFLGFRLVVSR
jgi:formylglycine-generating enzyme required for sulfatase activity/tRNA A-37 threonylcarbamoyl transferase component Bud32